MEGEIIKMLFYVAIYYLAIFTVSFLSVLCIIYLLYIYMYHLMNKGLGIRVCFIVFSLAWFSLYVYLIFKMIEFVNKI